MLVVASRKPQVLVKYVTRSSAFMHLIEPAYGFTFFMNDSMASVLKRQVQAMQEK